MPTRAEARLVYEKLLAEVQITQWGQEKAAGLAKIILGNKSRYQAVEAATGVPWQVIAALHHMECSGSFSQHLANGDPIAAPTIHVPAGIPGGTWEECAIAALKYKAWDPALSWKDWLTVLYRAEAYNGFGYWHKHPTPYLWSGTTAYTKGKYVEDGRYDPDAESQQVGVYPILMELELKCLVDYDKSNLARADHTHPPKTMSQIKLVTGQATWLKSSTAQSSDPSSDPKVKLQGNFELSLAAQPTIKAGHYEVTLAEPYMGVAKGYIWANHATIEGDDPDEVGTKPTAPPIAATDMKAIQTNLVRIGLLDPPADGKAGSLTKSAIRAFNRVVNGDDKGDELTLEALKALPDFPGFADLKFTPKENDAEHAIAIKCLNRMVALGAHIAVSMGSTSPAYNLFHVTGTNPDGTKNSNKINHWNDLRFVVEVSRSGLVSVKLCKLATCEPGQHWIDNPMNSGGTFRIMYDRQWFAWCVGVHGSRSYPALVQVREIEGYRDSDRDGSWSGEAETSGDYFGVNIHHGYDSELVGQMSAGCQVAKSIAGHEQFMELMKSDRRYKCNNGYVFANISLDGSKI